MENLRKQLVLVSDKSNELKSTEILKLSKLINEAADGIGAYDFKLGHELKDKANELRNYNNHDEKEHFGLFKGGLELLHQNITAFLMPL